MLLGRRETPRKGKTMTSRNRGRWCGGCWGAGSSVLSFYILYYYVIEDAGVKLNCV